MKISRGKTGLSYSQQGLAIEIWEVVSYFEKPEDLPATGAMEFVKQALGGSSGETAIPTLIDAHTVWYRLEGLLAGVGTYLPLVFWAEGHDRNFVPVKPKLYAYPDLFHYIQSSNSSALADGQVVIGFIYVDIGKENFYEVLQSYQQVFG